MFRNVLFMIFILLWPMSSFADDGEIIIRKMHANNVFVTVLDKDDVMTLRYEGAFTVNTDFIISTYVKTYDIDRIELNSYGGFLTHKSVSGEMVQDQGIKIIIQEGDICLSSCAFFSLYSPDIEINGVLAFHLPYSDVFDKGMTLYDISQHNVDTTLLMQHQYFKTGWKSFLHMHMVWASRNGKYIAFDSADELDKYRFNDFSEFMDGPIDNPQYQMMSDEDIMATLK